MTPPILQPVLQLIPFTISDGIQFLASKKMVFEPFWPGLLFNLA